MLPVGEGQKCGRPNVDRGIGKVGGLVEKERCVPDVVSERCETRFRVKKTS